MSKNIVICCDGTGNAIATHMTNVLRLYYILERDTPRQISLYRPGIGTWGAPGTITPIGRAITKLLAAGGGFGIDLIICDVYCYLVRNYQPGDRIFLFGFSRGAHVIRAVAFLLDTIELIRDGDESVVPYALELLDNMWKDRINFWDGLEKAFEFKKLFGSRKCPIWFVGVWDTVSATRLSLPSTVSGAKVACARQAIAIDEWRADFVVDIFKELPSTSALDLRQVWFPGVHSDVGGGYPDSESGLAKIALQWMLGEASDKGLLLDEDRTAIILGQRGTEYCKPNPDARIHNEMHWAWALRELIPRRQSRSSRKLRVNLGRTRTIPSNSLIHESAFLRAGNYSVGLPPTAQRVPSSAVAFHGRSIFDDVLSPEVEARQPEPPKR